MLKRCLGAFVARAFGLSAAAARADEVIVFAAASLTNALYEIGESFTAKTGHTVKPSYAASSAQASPSRRTRMSSRSSANWWGLA